ncbi:hypothetical protein, partial [Victivallis lenta]|uniref:hypothetical protein n=1 Tax=Victivallis lenta TaxID=2606640 RepID=UPI0019806AC0
NKSDYQEIVRISDAQNCKSVLISPAWRTPGTGFRPQILVKRLIFIFEIDFFYSFVSIWVLEGPDISTFQ